MEFDLKDGVVLHRGIETGSGVHPATYTTSTVGRLFHRLQMATSTIYRRKLQRHCVTPMPLQLYGAHSQV